MKKPTVPVGLVVAFAYYLACGLKDNKVARSSALELLERITARLQREGDKESWTIVSNWYLAVV